MRLNILIICFILGLFTEGVSQQVDTAYNVPIEEPIEDETEDAELHETAKPNPYEEAIKKYNQEDIQNRDFDKDAWKKATDGLDYTIEPEKKKEDKKANESPKNTTSPSISPVFSAFFKWFFIICGIAVLAFLILRFVTEGNVFGRRSRRVLAPSVEINLEKIEENLQESELDPLIRQAIAQKQYSLAVRLYYLAIVKELSLTNAIKWKKDKTNSEYVREMRTHGLFNPFKSLTLIFERVWYGDTTIDEATFLMIQPAFQDLLKQTRTT